jgi:hypothetical protein
MIIYNEEIILPNKDAIVDGMGPNLFFIYHFMFSKYFFPLIHSIQPRFLGDWSLDVF